MLENAYMPPEGQSTVSYIKNKRIFFLSIFGHFPEDMSRSDNRRNLYRTWFGRDQFGYIYQQPGQITEVFITTQPHLKNQPTTRLMPGSREWFTSLLILMKTKLSFRIGKIK